MHAAAVEAHADDRLGTGRRGENAALRDYLGHGYRLIARNWSCRLGEIDLVLARGSVLVVCEVKTRRGSGLGGPFEAVTPRKQAKLRRLGQACLLSESRAVAGVRDVRFDVASVSLQDDGRALVHRFEDAF